MTFTRMKSQRRFKSLASLLLGTAFIPLNFLGDCSDRFVDFSRYVDPCGSVLANCQPGDFEVNSAAVGDYCVDPACTVPGGCGNVGPVLGTTTELCP